MLSGHTRPTSARWRPAQGRRSLRRRVRRLALAPIASGLLGRSSRAASHWRTEAGCAEGERKKTKRNETERRSQQPKTSPHPPLRTEPMCRRIARRLVPVAASLAPLSPPASIHCHRLLLPPAAASVPASCARLHPWSWWRLPSESWAARRIGWCPHGTASGHLGQARARASASVRVASAGGWASARVLHAAARRPKSAPVRVSPDAPETRSARGDGADRRRGCSHSHRRASVHSAKRLREHQAADLHPADPAAAAAAVAARVLSLALVPVRLVRLPLPVVSV